MTPVLEKLLITLTTRKRRAKGGDLDETAAQHALFSDFVHGTFGALRVVLRVGYPNRYGCGARIAAGIFSIDPLV